MLNKQKLRKMKRKTLFQALFDVDTKPRAFNSPVVSAYHNLEDDTFEVIVKLEFCERPNYRMPVNISNVSKLDNLQKLYSFCKYALENVFPNYKGGKKITDFYASLYFEQYMYSNYGKLYIASNQDIPIKY